VKRLEEFDAAATHYAGIDPALGQRFYAVIGPPESPTLPVARTFRFIAKPARRHFTREFPFGIIYVERPEDILDSRRSCPSNREPGYWSHRLT